MARELNFDGSEITILKALEAGGSETPGEKLMDTLPNMLPVEIIDVLRGLIALGYVETDKHGLHNEDDLKEANFHINSGYSKDIKEALDPTPVKKSKRVRRE